MFAVIQKQYPGNFTFLFLRILVLYSRTVSKMFVYKDTEAIEYVKN